MDILKSSSSSLIRNIGKATENIGKLSTQLSSGKRVNKASDDAAGLAVIAALEADSASLGKASDNAAYGQSLVDIADGALQQQGDIATRLNELATQSANGTLNDTQRASLNQEYQSLQSEYNRISETTQFNGQKVFQDGGTSIQVGTGSGSDSQITLSTKSVSAPGGDISTVAGAQAAIDSTKQTLGDNSALRGKIGADSSRLEKANENIKSRQVEEDTAASRIRDVDIAEVAAKRTAELIRQQGGTAVLAQAGKLSGDVVRQLLS